MTWLDTHAVCLAAAWDQSSQPVGTSGKKDPAAEPQRCSKDVPFPTRVVQSWVKKRLGDTMQSCDEQCGLTWIPIIMSSTPSSRNTPRLVPRGVRKFGRQKSSHCLKRGGSTSFPHRPGLYGLQCFRQHADVFDSFHVRPVCTKWRGEHEKLLVWIWVLNPEWEGEKYIEVL